LRKRGEKEASGCFASPRGVGWEGGRGVSCGAGRGRREGEVKRTALLLSLHQPCDEAPEVGPITVGVPNQW
jgi:hypothetical protein